MGGACSTHVTEVICMQLLWLENLKGRNLSEDLVVDGRIILEWLLGKELGRCGLDAFISG